MNILQAHLTVNPYSRPGQKMKGINGVVLHYVGNPASTAMANRNYFENLKNGAKKTYASSHYIIGLQGEIIQCMPETEIAYHAGDSYYNSTYIGIECCHPDAGGRFNEQTYETLIKLLGDLCRKYDLDPQKQIIRHFDVTGKKCPLWYVNYPEDYDKLRKDVVVLLNRDEEEWAMRYQRIEDVPQWARATILKLVEYNYLNGDGVSLDLSEDMLRVFVVNDRAGVYDH